MKYLLFFFVSLGCYVPAAMQAAERPHIVFVMADDMGWGQTGYRNHPVLKTLDLDGMGTEGLRFERFYAGCPVCTMDLFPTVADLLDLPESVLTRPLDGVSLKPLFTQELSRRETPIPFRYGSRSAWIDNDYKLLTNDWKQGEFELYNLADESSEATEISQEQPAIAARLKTALLHWNESVDDSFAGRDYPEQRVVPADPKPMFWTETEAYRPYLPEWKDRWEFKRYIDRSTWGKQQ